MSTDFVRDHADLSTSINLLDKYLTKEIHDSHLPGLAIALVHQGDLIWGKGYGYANLEDKIPVTLDTRFRIASITKTFTSVAILQLVDAGKLRLDDPLSEYLPWFALQYPDAPQITVYHCLTHTSGLPRDATVPHWTENQFQDWDEVVKTTQTRQSMMPPLQDHSYSNLGYSLLGAVIESVSGEKWENYIHNHIVAELGMKDTLVAPKGDEGNFATGYLTIDENYQRQAVPFIETKGFSPSASVASTVNDLVKYAKFHLSKGQTPILSGYNLREMHRVHWVMKNWQRGYGLGIRTWRIGDWSISGHTGGYKGFSLMFGVCREHDTAVIALTNAINGNAYQLAEQAFKMILPEIIKITAKSQVADPIWQDYTGTYHNDWGMKEIVIRNAQLQVIELEDMSDTTTLLPTDKPDHFILQASGNYGESAYFERDESGKIVYFHYRHEYAVKN